MTEKPTDPHTTLVKQINSNSQPLYQLFKTLGAINQNIDFTTWESAWKSISYGIEQFNANQRNDTNQSLIDPKLPFNLDFNRIFQTLKQLNVNRASILTQVDSLLQTSASNLTDAISTNSALSAMAFTVLKQKLVQELTPFLGKEMAQVIIELENNPKQLAQVRTLLHMLRNQQTYTMLENILSSINTNQAFLTATSKQQFLQQLNQTLLLTGISYENQVANEQIQQTTIKEMLLHLLQNNDGLLKEPATKLLHFISGMQINSVQESTNFIQANLQIPAEKLGLTNDIKLDFESRKTEDGEINPEFCRILFYLDLAKLKETVIDMNIQRRSISITIFNDFIS
ncbi:hypothetical protein CV093_09550 [Oceanobacillus sp. 143]|nr:hypothetical protein CV093_09550 [Oceanobacillus sp. 143]